MVSESQIGKVSKIKKIKSMEFSITGRGGATPTTLGLAQPFGDGARLARGLAQPLRAGGGYGMVARPGGDPNHL